MNIIIGLDVSLASTAICAVDECGKVIREMTAASEPETLRDALEQIEGEVICVGLEAGPLSQWLYKSLTDAGFDVILMETRQVKSVLTAMPIKSDRRDAEGIARLLHCGWYRPVHCKSVSSQEIRTLLTTRKSLQKSKIDLELSLRGMLRNFGLKVGKVSRAQYDTRLRELAAGNVIFEAATEAILRARDALKQELDALEKRLIAVCKADPVCELIMTMPGVGPIVALTFRCGIDDPERFKSSKDVGAYLGLVPKRNQSGERDIVGHITKTGDSSLRAAAYQAATVMLNTAKPNWLMAWALRLAARRGKKRATVALARRICVVLHRMWKDGTSFQFTQEAAMKARAA